jgi:hypothetical protein
VESIVSRQLTALIVTSAIVFGNINGSAQPVAESQTQTQASSVAKNEAPLKPAGAAGIRQAQGIEDLDVWFFSGLILAAIVWVLVDNDDDDSSDSTQSTQ